MNRITDIQEANEDVLVPRVLIAVHKALDEEFPNISGPGRQFMKTVFADGSNEQTAVTAMPNQQEIEAAEARAVQREQTQKSRASQNAVLPPQVEARPPAPPVSKTGNIWARLLVILLAAGAVAYVILSMPVD